MRMKSRTNIVADIPLPPCKGCAYGCRAAKSRYICNHPLMNVEEAAAAMIDAFFGEVCKCYTSIAACEAERSP